MIQPLRVVAGTTDFEIPEGSTMRKHALAVVALLLAAQSAIAAPMNTSGTSALALAALVGIHSPTLTFKERIVLTHMLEGRLNFPFPANQIAVKADKVTCRASNVDISAHSCELAFGAKTRKLSGRAAHELYATLIESGVPSDGAAGSLFESLTALSCTVDPSAVKQKAGGGANCTFTAGP
jgi:hypothetical protein